MTRKPSRAEATANITGNWKEALEMQIQDHKSPNMDWLGMEAVLRAYVRDTKNADLDRIIAEFTLRGYELPEQPINP